MRRVSSAATATAFGPDPRSSDPLHRQLYDKLRDNILARRFSPGQQMPSTRVLASDLGVSRNTVLNAFEQLKAEGYLEGSPGSGTYIARALPEETTRVSNAPPSGSGVGRKHSRWSDFGARMSKYDVPFVRTGIPARPLQPGVPALDEFPFDIWTRLTSHWWKKKPSGLLAYGPAAGYMPLRKAIADYLNVARAVHCRPEQVLVVSGAQQAMDLTARLLLNPGEPAWVEEPGFLGAHAALDTAGVKLIPVPLDDDGLNVSIGRKKAPRARLIYTTPSHQFPLGITMTLARRLELLDWAQKSGAWILEDDYDSEFRYTSRPLPALQSLDQSGSVIYFGSFSKVLFPALRLGYLVVPPNLVDGFLVAKAITDHHCPTMEQAVLAQFIGDGHFNRHIRRMRALYLERMETLLDSIAAEMNGLIEVRRPDAGMHIVGLFPPGADDEGIAASAASTSVAVAPLSSWYLSRKRASGLLVGYAGYNPRAIRQAIRKLAKVIHEFSRNTGRISA
jgi:GntR family transcriptional regulator / MocR family aminotransferase